MTEPFAQQDVYCVNDRGDVEPLIPADARTALDVGCGRGGFALTLRRVLGPDARLVAIEPVPAQAQAARSQPFDEVVEGFFPDALNGRDERFDVISFNDVLEHFADPWEVLRECHRWLSPGGRVIAAIPNIQYWPAVLDLANGKWEYTESGLMDITHLRFFTRSTIMSMFASTGYRVEQCLGAHSVWGVEWDPDRIENRVRRKVISVARGLLARARPDGQFLHFVVSAVPVDRT